MNPVLTRVLCLIIGYAFGNIQAAYLLGKARGIDIREHGSGNSGTTNTIRVLGTKAGLIVFLIDACKCIAAVAIVSLLFGKQPDMQYLVRSWAFAGCVLGHDYPFFMNFRGGKGVAVMAGFVCCFHPSFLPLALCFFFVPYFLTHYVSLGSLCVYSGIFLAMIIEGQMGVFGPLPQKVLLEMYLIQAFFTFLVFWKHRANLHRLATGTESKTYLGKKM